MPLFIEPVMKVEMEAPGEEQGDLLGDLTRRRANIVAVESGASHAVLKALCRWANSGATRMPFAA
jgi:translation elongation factor EF-G